MNHIPQLICMVLIFLGIQAEGLAQEPTSQKLDPNMSLKKADADGIVWFEPREEPFELSGFEWITEDGVYRRLPVNPAWEIREAVDQLANHTAGGQLRFRTNSTRILLKVELRERSGMYHMPATGQSGFDIYLLDGEKYRYLKTTRFPHDSIRYQVELFKANVPGTSAYTINFPLYNGVNSVLIGLEKGSLVEAPPPFTRPGKIVVYGTSITQGGCVGRPGMAYTNILSRQLDMQFVNLGFSGNGRGEPALAHLITQIPEKHCIVLDYEANAGMSIKETLEPFVDILRDNHPHIPILIVSKIRYSYDQEGSVSYARWVELRDFQRELVHTRRNAGDRHIHFLDGSTVLGSDYDECTVDGVHPNDLGSFKIANALHPVIEEILQN